LDPQVQFYLIKEDKYQSSAIHFENMIGEVGKEGGSLVVLEERVQEDAGNWLYLLKHLTLTEEELVKVRKTKPKGLSLNDLPSQEFRAWFSYEDLHAPNAVSTSQKCALTYVVPTDPLMDQSAQYSDLQGFYVSLRLSLDRPLCPRAAETRPGVGDFIAPPDALPQLDPARQSVQDFKSELLLDMQSLAMEFYRMSE